MAKENNNKIKLNYTNQYKEARRVLIRELKMEPVEVAVMTDSDVLDKLAEEFFEFYGVDEDGEVNFYSVLLVKKSDFNKMNKVWVMG